MPDILETLRRDQRSAVGHRAQQLLGALVQSEQYVGDVYSLNYETALVLIHDRFRMRVGGIPGLCFLIATRIKSGEPADPQAEDSSVILLRVMDAAPLPEAGEIERLKVEAAQRAAGESSNWDESAVLDAHTAQFLAYAGVRCRVIGTFYLDARANGAVEDLFLRFGSDLSNYYPSRGLKVYKANAEALSSIVNFRDPDRVLDHPLGAYRVRVGRVRYASTNRSLQGVSEVVVDLSPADLVDQKTALFGMTRSGKSNTTKIIARSVFDLRFEDARAGRIGQLVFDTDGEYANENVQDRTALKNVWRRNRGGLREDVRTYGISPHPLDPGRRLMKLNFFLDENLQTGKQIIDEALQEYREKYITNFLDVVFEAPDPTDRSASTRYNRNVLVYRTLLVRAGFQAPSDLRPKVNGLFGRDLLNALASSQSDPAGEHARAARTLGGANPTWGALASAFSALRDFIKRGGDTGYNAFNDAYMTRPGGSGNPWHDATLEKLLEMFFYPNGPRLIGHVAEQHSPDVRVDYADDIYEDLVNGRLVIVDQSVGEPEMSRAVAERVMWRIFRGNQERFTHGEQPPSILVYIEEAHNLLPAGANLSQESRQNVWIRAAKEGAKYHLGLVYITQEVSSIHNNILKNTANWFIGHLNNTDETKELRKYYDFEDFEPSIRRAQDRGFLRVKTLSNLFVVPVQIDRFEA